ncbi:MAG: hypothetical protein WCG52_09930, partial [bacterium]
MMREKIWSRAFTSFESLKEKGKLGVSVHFVSILCKTIMSRMMREKIWSRAFTSFESLKEKGKLGVSVHFVSILCKTIMS